MVYRGKPSAGCENCRKAKKRCGLEQPSCARCVKLKKTCSGYRDTSQLQIHDESASVKQKADRQKVRVPVPQQIKLENGIATPDPVGAQTSHSDSSDDAIDIVLRGTSGLSSLTWEEEPLSEWDLASAVVPASLQTSPDDLATAYFFSTFIFPNGHWKFLQDWVMQSTRLDPALSLAIRACGMAALDNVQKVEHGRDYSLSLYGEALRKLNAALRDPKRSRTDESLITVSLLSYHENITCESRQSVQSWKAHITGSMQLLKIRGKAQFKTAAGRVLFRETRVHIIIHCIWDDLEPPAFMWELEEELERMTVKPDVMLPGDQLTRICYDFASLRNKMATSQLSDADAMKMAAQIEHRMIQWSLETMGQNEFWRYHEIEVPDSPDVWNGIVHAYGGHPAPSVWNTYRSVRIMLTRTQTLLTRRLKLPEEQEKEQMAYYRGVRRQMSDEICAGTPSQLGHAAAGFNSPCILVTAYSSIWPLFFAGTCALERVDHKAWAAAVRGDDTGMPSAAIAQASWVIGRMKYISKHVGLKWADGVAATLKGDFAVMDVDDVLPSGTGYERHGDNRLEWSNALRKTCKDPDGEDSTCCKSIREPGRGPRILIEDEPIYSQPRKDRGPIWREQMEMIRSFNARGVTPTGRHQESF